MRDIDRYNVKKALGHLRGVESIDEKEGNELIARVKSLIAKPSPRTRGDDSQA